MRQTHELSSYEIERSARLLKAEYGCDAEEKARWRIGELLRESDSALAIVAWARILVAIERLRGSY